MVQRYFRFLSVASNNFTSLAWGILKANFWEFEFDPQVQSWLAVCIGWVTGSLIKQWSKRRKNELDERSPTKLSASQPILTMTHIQLHNKSPNKLHSTLQWRWVNYGPLDPWNIFCTIFSTEYFLCQTFWAGLLRWTFLLSCECESATQTLDFNCNWKYGQFPFLILQCWVMRVFVKSTCSSVKWNSLVITNHLSVASRFPLCGQYIITKFIHLPFVIDFIRRQSSRNFRSLALT